MRIGKFNQIIDRATDPNNNKASISLNPSPLYNNQAYKITNFTPKYNLIAEMFKLGLLEDDSQIKVSEFLNSYNIEIT